MHDYPCTPRGYDSRAHYYMVNPPLLYPGPSETPCICISYDIMTQANCADCPARPGKRYGTALHKDPQRGARPVVVADMTQATSVPVYSVLDQTQQQVCHWPNVVSVVDQRV